MVSLSQITKSIRHSIFELDIFGYPLNLQIKKNQEFHTYIGLIVSLGIEILVAYSFISLMIVLFEKKSPNVITNILYEQNPEQYLLQKSTFMFAVALTDDKGVPYFQKKGNYTYQAQLDVCTRQSDANNNIFLHCDSFILKPCLSLNLSSDIITEMNITKTTLASSVCLSEDAWEKVNISFQGTPQSPIFKSLYISISQCYNATMNNECAQQDLIDTQLSNAYLAILVTDKVLNQQQQGYPFKTVTKLVSTRISPSVYKTLTILFRKSNFINYENFYYYFGQETNYEILQVDHSQEQLELAQKSTIIQVALYLDDRSNVYYRTYDNVLNIFGQVSGLLELLTLLIGLLINPINKLSQQLYLTSEIYTIDNIKTEDLKIHPDLSFTESENDSLKIMKLKKYFKMKNSKSQINLFNYLTFTGQRKKVIDNSICSLYQKIDASFILNKMIEIDKLKKIILTDDQQMLFNYIHKPRITFDRLRRGKSGSFYENEDDNFEQKIMGAYESFQRIKQNNQLIDQNLLKFMDKDIKAVFEGQQQQLNNSTINQDQKTDMMIVQTIEQE